jgi:hypothetical protein
VQARLLLERDPTARAAWDAALAGDPELAASPDKKRDWLYRRLPAYDDRYMLLPIYRADAAPAPASR